jgi:hypothetical protein
MADRNPFIPSERRQDVESRSNINEDEANRDFAEKQAKLQHKTNKAGARQGATQAKEGAKKEGEDV